MKPARINALKCAIVVLEGTDGGYTETQKYKAKLELEKLLAEEESGRNVKLVTNFGGGGQKKEE